MSFLAGLGSSVASGALDLIGNVAGSWATNSAKESLNKNITKTNLKYQKEYDTWTQAQDKAYEEWWQNYLYDLQNNQYYNLARKYAENTASWAVTGLKKAGLNPILAGIDSNLSSSMGSANPQQSGHKVGGGSVRGAAIGSGSPKLDLGIVSRNMQAQSAARQAESQADINEIQKDVDSATKDAKISTAKSDASRASAAVMTQQSQTANLDSNTALSQAQVDSQRANVLLTAVRAANEARTGGLNGFFGFASRLAEDVVQGDKYEALDRHVDRALGLTGDTSNTARSDSSKRPSWIPSDRPSRYDLIDVMNNDPAKGYGKPKSGHGKMPYPSGEWRYNPRYLGHPKN